MRRPSVTTAFDRRARSSPGGRLDGRRRRPASFARAGRAGDVQLVVRPNPVAGDQARQQAFRHHPVISIHHPARVCRSTPADNPLPYSSRRYAASPSSRCRRADAVENGKAEAVLPFSPRFRRKWFGGGNAASHGRQIRRSASRIIQQSVIKRRNQPDHRRAI